MRPGDEGARLVQIGAQLLGGPGLSRIISGGLDAAGQGAEGLLEAAYVVALPALDGDGDGGQLLKRRFSIDAQGRVFVTGEGVRRGRAQMESPSKEVKGRETTSLIRAILQ